MDIHIQASDSELKKAKVGETVTVIVTGKVKGLELKSKPEKDSISYPESGYPGSISFFSNATVKIKPKNEFDELFKDED